MASDLFGARASLPGMPDLFRHQPPRRDRCGRHAAAAAHRAHPARGPAAQRRRAARARGGRARARALARRAGRGQARAVLPGARAAAGLHRRARRRRPRRHARRDGARGPRPGARRSAGAVRPRDRPLRAGRRVRLAAAPTRTTSSASTSATASATCCCAGPRARSTSSASCRPAWASSTRSTSSTSAGSSRCATASAVPDTLVGTDSHTTMINGLGVLGFGVGGIEAEAVMLGEPLELGTPVVVGVRLTGRAARGRHRDRPRAHADRAAAQARRRRPLRRVLRRRPLGALAGRPRDALEHVARVRRDGGALPGRRRDAALPARDRPRRRSCRSSTRTARSRACSAATAIRRPSFNALVELDLDGVVPSLAGPRRPQDRVPLADVPASFTRRLPAARERRTARPCTTATS